MQRYLTRGVKDVSLQPGRTTVPILSGADCIFIRAGTAYRRVL